MARSRRSLFARIERYLARKLFQLPPRVQLLLSGAPALQIDGRTLHPEMQLLLSARKMRGAGSLRAANIELARKNMRHEALHFAGESPALGGMRDLEIPVPHGTLRARHYAPQTADIEGAQPLLVFFHGGGFVLGDIDTFDEPCQLLCHHAEVHVLSVEYRLAPEHPFPAGVDDAIAAFRWAVANAASLGADAARVGVGGDSAGGNLATVVAQQTLAQSAVDESPTPAFQLLIYPVVDRVTQRPSLTHFADGLLLTRSDMDWFDMQYIGTSAEHRKDPRVSPLLAPSLAGLCPAVVVTAEFDPLRDEGEAYAAALARAGVPTVSHRFTGMIHGFLNMGGVSPAARASLLEIALRLREVSHAARS